MDDVRINLGNLQQQLGVSKQQIDMLAETCVNAVTAVIYSTWEAEAKRGLKSSLPNYLANLIKVDKGRFEKAIVLTGVVPNMIEQGATPFDIKEGFKRSPKVRHTIPVYNKKGKMVYAGGDWYLTIPFRIGTPGTVGQAGFNSEMPQEVYDVMLDKGSDVTLSESEIPAPYDEHRTRGSIQATPTTPYYAEYQHKNSIYEGMTKRTAQYGKTTQNTYGTFRRAGKNSDPLSWIHRGIDARHFAERAVEDTDVDTIVKNEAANFINNL